MLPRVILHNEVGVDRRIDWFSPNIGQYYGLVARWQVDAILAGSDTMLSYQGELRGEEDVEAFEP